MSTVENVLTNSKREKKKLEDKFRSGNWNLVYTSQNRHESGIVTVAEW